MQFSTATIVAFFAGAWAYDGFPDDLNERLGAYIPPGPNDSRGPCPALNTLANHGLINRNGSDLFSTDIVQAFKRGFGIDETGIDQSLHNFEVVCEYATGVSCGYLDSNGNFNGTFLLKNLTLLGEPHAFEHDNSYSRQDYGLEYGPVGSINDNIYFNSTEFQVGLDVVGYTPTNPPQPALASYLDFNAIRLQRVSRRFSVDVAGYLLNVPTQLFETGFIFGATFNRDSLGNMVGTVPQVRLDWWNFWFSEESFPTQLGWTPASTTFFDFNFISSVSKEVLATLPASIPSPLPSGATNTTAPAPTNLPEGDPSQNPVLFQSAAYVAPTAPSNILSETATATPAVTAQKRDVEERQAQTTIPPASLASTIASVQSSHPHVITSALSMAGPAPPQYDMYQQKLNLASLKAQISMAQSYEKKIVHLVTSILGDL